MSSLLRPTADRPAMRRVIGEAEAEVMRMKESATAGLLEMKVDLFGRDSDGRR